MIQYRQLRDLFEGRATEAQRQNRSLTSARVAALEDFYEALGMGTVGRGVPAVPLNDNGMPDLRPNRASAREVSLRILAESIMGHDFVEEYYHPSSGFNFSGLQEAAIDPTAFVNISTFNLATAGLINAEIMERFNQPEFIGRNIVQIRPLKTNGVKLVGVSRLPSATKAAKGRLPGEPHASLQFGEAYQTTPETAEQALKVEVTNEAVFFDYTGQVMDEASNVGNELGYGQEKDIADTVMGVANSYNRNGTSINTYQTSSPFINDQSNPFSDETDVDDARQLFVGMTDPETGKEILVNGLDILCMPGRELRFREQLFGNNVQVGTQLNSNFPSRWTNGPSRIRDVMRGDVTVTALSAIWFNRATAADGLNLSAANAKEYWWIGDFKKAFWWTENWGLTPWMASADEYVLKDRGIISVHGANYRGVAYAREPRYSVRNKN